MLGQLAKTLTVGGSEYAIRTDFRIMLTIFEAFADPELDEREKCFVCLKCLFEDFDSIPPEHLSEAAEKAYRFADGDMPRSRQEDIKLIDWEQDAAMIFPAVNKAAGFEVREVGYMHWHTFLGMFSVIGDGLFSEVVHIRAKRAKGKPLDKAESEFYRTHRALIDIKNKLSEQQEAEDEAFLKELLG